MKCANTIAALSVVSLCLLGCMSSNLKHADLADYEQLAPFLPLCNMSF